MSQKKRHYTREFKQQVVNLSETTDKPLSEIERELGITQGLLTKWRKKQKQGQERFGQTTLVEQNEAEKELARLQRENAVLRQEREILKESSLMHEELSSALQTDEIRVHRPASNGI